MGRAKKTGAGENPVPAPVVIKTSALVETGIEQKIEKPLRPSQCATHLRKTVAEAFRAITAGFVAEAKLGGCQHVKMAAEIVKAPGPRAGRKRGKGSAGLMLEKYGGEFGELPEDDPLRLAGSQ